MIFYDYILKNLNGMSVLVDFCVCFYSILRPRKSSAITTKWLECFWSMRSVNMMLWWLNYCELGYVFLCFSHGQVLCSKTEINEKSNSKSLNHVDNNTDVTWPLLTWFISISLVRWLFYTMWTYCQATRKTALGVRDYTPYMHGHAKQSCIVNQS